METRFLASITELGWFSFIDIVMGIKRFAIWVSSS